MQCPKCDNQNLPEAKFCAQCGQVLPDSEEPQAPTPKGSLGPTFGGRGKSDKPWAAIVGGIVGAMPGIFLLIMAAVSRNDPGDFIPERTFFLLLAIASLVVATPIGAIAGNFVAGELRRFIKHPVWAQVLGGVIGGIFGIVILPIVIWLLFVGLIG